MTANDSSYLNTITGAGSSNDIAIRLVNNYGVAQSNSYLISENQINKGIYNSTLYSYLVAGISVQSSAVINNNIIRGLGASSNGIVVEAGVGATATKHHSIQGNAIYRLSQSIEAYIKVTATTSSDTGICVDNFFDSPTIDGSSTVVVKTAPSGWLVERNKNQTVAQIFDARQGLWSIATVIAGIIPTTTSSNIVNNVTDPYITTYTYDHAPTTETIAWKIPLVGNVPNGVTITGVEVNVWITSLAATRQFGLTLNTPSISSTQGWNLTTSPTLYQLTLTGTHVVVPTNSPIWVPEVIMNFSTGHSTTLEIIITSFTIYYRW